MKAITKGQVFHRTQLLPQEQADRFARCLMANALFENVQVQRSATAKGERCFFVLFQPSSDQRQRELIRQEMEVRARRAEEQAENYLFCLDDTQRFFHCLNFESGEVYETTHQTCTCGDFTYRGAALQAHPPASLRECADPELAPGSRSRSRPGALRRRAGCRGPACPLGLITDEKGRQCS